MVLVGVSAALSAAKAQNAGDRPRVALVLSGGGAAGAAHIGVLKALVEEGFEPDCVVGTSMGAVVGGLYAAGLSPAELETAVLETDWFSLLGAAPNRAVAHPKRRPRRLEPEPLSRLPLGAKNGEIRADAGVVDANRLFLRLREMALPATGVTDFDDLDPPFRAIATDLATGEAVTLRGGDLALALRASMSIPAVFPPIRQGGRVLVDGGVANNLPIDVGKTLCGDRIIAVSIPPSDPDPESLSTLVGALGQTMSIFIAKSTRDQLGLWRGQYELITPPVQDIGMLEFDRIEEAMRRGYDVAKPIAADLARRLRGDDAAGAARSAARADRKRRAAAVFGEDGARVIAVNSIRLENSSFYRDDVILAYLGLSPPERVSVAELARRLERLEGLRAFDVVAYRLDPGGVLVVTVEERASGRTEFRLGAAFQDSFDGRARYSFGAGVGFTGLDDLGLRVDLDAAIGSDQFVKLEVEQPLDPAQRWFLSALIYYDRRQSPLTALEGARVADYRLSRLDFGADLTWAPFDSTRFAVGGRFRRRNAELATGDPVRLPSVFGTRSVGPRFAIDIDTLDDDWVPSSGFGLGAEAFFAFSEFEPSRPRTDVAVDAVAAFDLGDIGAYGFGALSAQGFARGGASIGGDDEIGFNLIGGFQRLSGFERDALNGELAGVVGARLILDAPLVENAFGLSSFVGASAEYGGAWDRAESAPDPGGFFAGSVFGGVRTRIGPLFLGFGAAQGGRRSIYLGFGERF